MNRRGFLSSMIRAGMACAVLPSALTYERIWKPRLLANPVFYEVACPIESWVALVEQHREIMLGNFVASPHRYEFHNGVYVEVKKLVS